MSGTQFIVLYLFLRVENFQSVSFFVKENIDQLSVLVGSSQIWTDILALYSLSIIQQNSTHCLILFCFVWYSYRILYKFSKANNSVKIIPLDTLMSKCTMNTPSFSRYFLTRFEALARVYFIDYTE